MGNRTAVPHGCVYALKCSCFYCYLRSCFAVTDAVTHFLLDGYFPFAYFSLIKGTIVFFFFNIEMGDYFS